MCHVVVGNHMVMHMYDKTWVHEDMLFYKRGVCDTYEIQGNFRDFK